MDARFFIAVDPSRSLVRIVMSGFFERSDIDLLLQARDAAHAELRCGPNEHVTLVDIRDMDIQSSDAVAAFTQVLGDPVLASRHLAFVVRPTLARAQIRRAAAGRGASFFESVRDAERWLTADRTSSTGLHECPPRGQRHTGTSADAGGWSAIAHVRDY